MKIIGQRLNLINPNRTSAEALSKPTTAAKRSETQDSITIHRSTDLPVSQFLSKLKHAISAEVNAGASPEKLDGLKRQIALQEYEINPTDIVRKMMLNGGKEGANE